MKIVKTSNYTGFDISKPQDYIRTLDTDIENLFLFTQGRVRLGNIGDGDRGENLSGEFQVFSCGAVGTTTVVTHTLAANPSGFLLIDKSGFGDLYMATTSNALATFATTATSGTNYTVFLLK